jgi:hypothetical protein
MDQCSAADVQQPKVLLISDKEQRIHRRERQTHELEKNQQELKASIAESKRLVDEADAMIRRHRHECEAGEASK